MIARFSGATMRAMSNGGDACALAVPAMNHSIRAGSTPESKLTRRVTTPAGTTRSGGHMAASASCAASQVRTSSLAEAPVSIHTAMVTAALLSYNFV